MTLSPGLSRLARATLKSWVEPGDEATVAQGLYRALSYLTKVFGWVPVFHFTFCIIR